MVSLDSPEKNAAFAEAHGGVVPVLSDPGKHVAKAHGVLGVGGLIANRWTFIIDPAGHIAHVDRNVRTGAAGADVVARLESLNVPRREPPKD